MILGALVVVSIAGGGVIARMQFAGADDIKQVAAGGVSDVRRVGSGSLFMGAQPAASTAPHAGPSATPSTSPSGKPSPSPSKSSSKPKPSSPKPTKTTPPAGSSVVDQLLSQINNLRAQHGLPAYTLLSGLNASAHKHNLKMMGSCGMQHQCPGEASLGSRISAEGVHWNACGENIGWSGPHPDTKSAMISAAEGLTTAMYNEKPPNDGHRENLLSTSFHHIGIDVVRDSSGKIWLTQDFSN